MKKTPRLTSALCGLAIVMVTYTPARATFGGELRRDQVVTVELTPSGKTTATIRYLDDRGIDFIAFMTAISDGVAEVQTFPPPGRRAKRVTIEVDPPLGGRASLRVNQFPALTIEESGGRLVFDVVDAP